MEIENDLSNNKKKNFYSYADDSNTKIIENNINTKILLSDGIFRNKNPVDFHFLFNNNCSSDKPNSPFPPKFHIFSSAFTRDNIYKTHAKPLSNQNIKESIKYNKIINSNDIQQHIKNNNNMLIESNQNNIKENKKKKNITPNHFLINYKIYNIKENSIFHIKLYDQFIKFYPIFTNLTDLEKYICYNPMIEKNEHFGIITQNYRHEPFYIKNYEVSNEKLEILKDKYVKHLYTKRNIISVEEIFKYIFEEIKINLSCINAQSPYDDVLKNCSNLINNINELINEFIKGKKSEEVLKITNNNNTTKIENINNFEITKNEGCSLINSSPIINDKNVYVLNEINSKSIQSSFLEINKNSSIEDNSDKKENRNNDAIEKEDGNKNEENNKKDNFTCLYCSRIFNSYCGLGGHMSKRHPKKQIK